MANNRRRKLTASTDGNALHIDGDTVESLSTPGIGDIQIAVKFDRKTGLPVLWLWQAFNTLRIDSDQMSEIVTAWEGASKRRKPGTF